MFIGPAKRIIRRSNRPILVSLGAFAITTTTTIVAAAAWQPQPSQQHSTIVPSAASIIGAGSSSWIVGARKTKNNNIVSCIVPWYRAAPSSSSHNHHKQRVKQRLSTQLFSSRTTMEGQKDNEEDRSSLDRHQGTHKYNASAFAKSQCEGATRTSSTLLEDSKTNTDNNGSPTQTGGGLQRRHFAFLPQQEQQPPEQQQGRSNTSDDYYYEEMPLPIRAERENHAVYGTLLSQPGHVQELTIFRRCSKKLDSTNQSTKWHRSNSSSSSDNNSNNNNFSNTGAPNVASHNHTSSNAVNDRIPLVVAVVRLGHKLDGHVGIVHGGIIALLVDDVLGFAYEAIPIPTAMTANLNLNFRRPLLQNTQFLIQVYLIELVGRKLVFSFRVTSPDNKDLYCEGTSVFVVPREHAEAKMSQVPSRL
ncbi:hypothetical protein ACA910_020507 [Epithemia clementina (nom. ined.)]